MFSITGAGPKVALDKIGDPDPSIEGGNMAGFTFCVRLNYNDIPFHELVSVRVIYFEFAEAHSSKYRTIVLCMHWLVLDYHAASLQSEPNVLRTFADTSRLCIFAQMLGKFFSVERHGSA